MNWPFKKWGREGEMAKPDDADIYFPPERDAPPQDVFELGLVLGGTVVLTAVARLSWLGFSR